MVTLKGITKAALSNHFKVTSGLTMVLVINGINYDIPNDFYFHAELLIVVLLIAVMLSMLSTLC